jgi:hypothetical protein
MRLRDEAVLASCKGSSFTKSPLLAEDHILRGGPGKKFRVASVPWAMASHTPQG